MAHSIVKEIRVLSSLVVCACALFIAVLWVYFDYRELQQSNRDIQEGLLRRQEEQLRERVTWAVNLIEQQRQQTEKQLQDTIRARTYEACSIATWLVSRYQAELDPVLLRRLVRDSLRTIRYNGGRGYFFAINVNGTEELYADKPQLEGQDLTDQQDSNGQFVVKEMLALARKSGEGFYRYTWSKPGSSRKDHVKIAFVRHLPALDWVIGTGEYLEDVSQDLQQEILSRLESLRMGTDGQSYFFVGSWDGLSLAGPAKGKNMLGVQDSNGQYIVKDLIRTAREGGGFVRYVMPKLQDQRPEPKLSYVAPVNEWHWYVGTGEYVDYIEAQLLQARQRFSAALREHLLYIALAALTVLLVNIFLIRQLARRLNSQAQRVVTFFQQAASFPAKARMEEEGLAHEEFQAIGQAAKKMIRQREAALNEARTAQEDWQRTFDTIQDAILFFDREGFCVRANQAAESLFSVRCSPLVGVHYKDCLCEENLVDRSLEDLQVHHDHISSLLPGRFFYASSYPLLEGDTLDSIIYVLADVTGQKQLEAQLAQSQRLESIGRLAGGVAHDFNNILSAIVGNAELCRLRLDRSHPLQERLELIKQSGERAARLTRQLLAFSRKDVMLPQVMDLGHEVCELNKMLARLLGENIEVQTEIEADLWPVKMDHGQFEQIIINLAVNARDAMTGGGTLFIRLANAPAGHIEAGDSHCLEPGDYVLLQVRDSGSGMSAEVIEHIFEPFYSTKERDKGTGLGLATVHGIVKQNRGEIFVSSEPGQGTSFRVYLPRHHGEGGQNTALRQEHKAEDLRGGNETLLIVEDNADVQVMLAGYLADLGYVILQAGNGEEALDLCSGMGEKTIDLLIADMVMPRMGGAELAEKLEARYPGLPVLFLSGYTEDAIVRSGVLQEGVNFLHKPFTPGTLAAKVRNLLDGMVKKNG